MALRRYHNDLIPFPGPNRTNVFYPNIYRDYRARPYDRDRYDDRHPPVREDREYRERRARDLIDKSLKDHGDLGWPLDFATGWCYKFLLGNQTHVADVVDKIRGLEDVEERTPYLIFDVLDKALFGGKLKGMVHLQWTAQANCACGRTNAPGVKPGIARVCIELNSVPFEEEDGDIDELLDALIHQMIHAFFLVCCGAQPKGAKADGRLTDGLHFGVILMLIQDITNRHCQDGPLPLIFYANTRRNLQGQPNRAAASSRHGGQWTAIAPQGSSIMSPPTDGQSHCSHDNRRIRLSEIKNWQVEKYSLSVDLNSDERGDVIHDLGIDGQLVPMDRLKGPPSSTYIELLWEDKRIMVTREKSLKFASLKKPIERQGKMELKVPDCSMTVLQALFDFMQHGVYWENPSETRRRWTSRRPQGPPVLHQVVAGYGHAICGMLDHIRVFKTAESMKFEELQAYALKRLYDMPTTSDDPIEALKEVYNDGKDHGKPIHAELHKWSRKFLSRHDNVLPSFEQYHQSLGSVVNGISNYEKIIQTWPDRFQELFNRSMALKDDCKHVYSELVIGPMPDHQLPGTWGFPPAQIAPLAQLPHSARIPRHNSWTDFNAVDWPRISPNYTPLASATPSLSGDSVDDIGIGTTFARPGLLDWTGPSRLWPSVSFDERTVERAFERH